MKVTRNADKVSVIGAGNVGAALAQRILEHDLADVVLLDIDEGICRGKAYDLQDASPVMGYEKSIQGTSDYSAIRDSHIVVITAGFPRQPGMSREDLIQRNGAIVKEVSLKIKEFAPEAIVIVVTNPLDIMSYIAYKVTGFDRKKVFGMYTDPRRVRAQAYPRRMKLSSPPPLRGRDRSFYPTIRGRSGP